MTAALPHFTRSRTAEVSEPRVDAPAIPPELRVADPRRATRTTEPGPADPDSSLQLLLLSSVWAGTAVSACLLGTPWRTGAFDVSLPVATLFALAAVLGLVLLVGFFQEGGAAVSVGSTGHRVDVRYGRILLAALLVVGAVAVVVSGAGARIAFGREQVRYDSAVGSYLETPTDSVRIAGVTYSVDATARELRLEPADDVLWGPPSLVWVRDGGMPDRRYLPSPTNLGDGWYME